MSIPEKSDQNRIDALTSVFSLAMFRFLYVAIVPVCPH
jgi:hypothetical protein